MTTFLVEKTRKREGTTRKTEGKATAKRSKSIRTGTEKKGSGKRETSEKGSR